MKRLIVLGFMALAGCASSPQAPESPPPAAKAEVMPNVPAKPPVAAEIPEAVPLAERIRVVFGSDSCWTYTGNGYEYVASLKAGDKVTMDFSGAYNAGTEADESQWEARDAVLMPLDGKGGAVVASDIRNQSDSKVIGHDGTYLMTFAPESSKGWKGKAKICIE